ncbi:hypothetical protein HKX48_001966 [Thoreauomyces humboldtii]|nr:hypothetical protein HKX48_001966 [Thoreauomyces humboldtii]
MSSLGDLAFKASSRCSLLAAPSRAFTASSAARYPRKSAPNTAARAPTSAQLAAPPVERQTASKQRPWCRNIPLHIRALRPTAPRRHITDTDTAVPLPTTFPVGTTRATFVRPRIPEESLPITDANLYPYAFYEISLRRSLNGLSASVKEHVHALGLWGRGQVVWRPVAPLNAGLILKARELVSVRLVNEIPEKQKTVKGYAKVGRAVATATELRV